MYFWKTRELATQIKDGVIDESMRKNYYLATVVFSTISVYFLIGAGTPDFVALAVEGGLIILINIVGINITFVTNRGNEGKDYIARVVMLSLPLIIKLFVFSFPVGLLLLGIVAGASGELDILIVEWSMALLVVVIQLIYFWRINVHLQRINT